ncbi:MAG: glutamine amidotransferase [Myxococcota bacterium]
MSRTCIIKTGTTLASLRPTHGDYDAWIAAGLGCAPETVDVVDVQAGETLPDPASPAAVVVTGSAAKVSDREGWSELTADWLREVVAGGVPTLGICYGHQLLAHALGGRVGANPRGREIGTVEVRFEPAAALDPLFSVLPRPTRFHATHVETVLALPDGAERFAESDLDACQAFRVGEASWGVQFHPEFDATAIRTYLDERRAILADEGLDADALLARVVETPSGPRLLERFAELIDAQETS